MKTEAEEDEEGEVDCEGEGLDGETGEEDVVRFGGVFAVGFVAADQGGAGDLGDCAEDIDCDEQI